MSGTSKGEPRPRRRRFHPMTSAKKHHFVPQFLLKHFARAGTSQVHVFDKLTDKVFVANVADVAAEHRLYEFTVGEFHSDDRAFARRIRVEGCCCSSRRHDTRSPHRSDCL